MPGVRARLSLAAAFACACAAPLFAEARAAAVAAGAAEPANAAAVAAGAAAPANAAAGPTGLVRREVQRRKTRSASSSLLEVIEQQPTEKAGKAPTEDKINATDLKEALNEIHAIGPVTSAEGYSKMHLILTNLFHAPVSLEKLDAETVPGKLVVDMSRLAHENLTDIHNITQLGEKVEVLLAKLQESEDTSGLARSEHSTHKFDASRILDAIVTKARDAVAGPPKWSAEPQTHAGKYQLPRQPRCQLLVPNTHGNSRFGLSQSECKTCGEACTHRNRQPPIEVNYDIVPGLAQQPTEDLIMHMEFASIEQLRTHAANGLYHKMSFEVQADRPRRTLIYHGEMGPQVMGGAEAHVTFSGHHVFQIMDAVWSKNGLNTTMHALPLGEPGNLGSCRRICLVGDCEHHPEKAGTQCTTDVSMASGSSFVYRLHKVSPVKHAELFGVQIKGSEWEVSIIDPVNLFTYSLGTILLQGTESPKTGVVNFHSSHEHIGCAACDAYYQAVRATGPFFLRPHGVHEVHAASTERPPLLGRTCFQTRVVALGGYTLLMESGPDVKPAYLERSLRSDDLLYRCPTRPPKVFFDDA